jgi:hypothetical protein
MRPQTWKPFFDARVNERTRELLEDFDVLGNGQHLVLVRRGEHLTYLRENVGAALVASTLHLKSLDYAKRRYCEPENGEADLDPVAESYLAAYHSAKSYVTRLLEKLETEGHPDPTVGVFGASLALARLPPSFFCAHLLYRLGHHYEGHAVSRLILEQIAWAYAAHKFDDRNAVAKIETTRAISHLKHFDPDVGPLYGFLSKKTHIDYSSHGEFLHAERGKIAVAHSQPRFAECGQTVLFLADLFGIVWELSLLPYIEKPEAIVLGKDGPIRNSERPFLKTMNEHLDQLESVTAKKERGRNARSRQSKPSPKATRRKRRTP